MKYLYIVRHAKSSWNEPELSDFERPLNDRGKESVKVMGAVLKDRKIKFDAVLSSPAKRAIKTARGVCRIMGFEENNIDTDPTIYHASRSHLVKTVCSFKDKHENIALFGHNPGLTDLYNYLTGEYLNNLPTCAVAKISFDVESWSEISESSGSVEFLETPKKHGVESDD